MASSQQKGTTKKIPCDKCRRMFPKGTALTVDGWEMMLHFCDLRCFEDWKREKGDT